MSTVAVVPGSFDPVTLGHLDVIERAAGLFDEVHVVVVHNPGKEAMFPIAQRVTLLEQAIAQAGREGKTRRHVVECWITRRLLHRRGGDRVGQGNTLPSRCFLRTTHGDSESQPRRRRNRFPPAPPRERPRLEFSGAPGGSTRRRCIALCSPAVADYLAKTELP